MTSDFNIDEFRFQSWSELPRFNSDGSRDEVLTVFCFTLESAPNSGQKSPKRIKDSPVSTLAFDEQKIYGFCPHQDLMCVAQCSTCHSHYKLRSLRTHMNNRHNAKLKSPEGLSHGFMDVSSPPATYLQSEVRLKAEISSDSGVSTSSSNSQSSRDCRRNNNSPPIVLPVEPADDEFLNLFDKLAAEKSNRLDPPSLRHVKTEPLPTELSEQKGKVIDSSQQDAKLQKPRVKLKNAVEAAAAQRNRVRLSSGSPPVTVATPRQVSLADVRGSKSAQVVEIPEKIPFFPPEIPTRPLHHHPSTVASMLRSPSMIPLGRKLSTTTADRPPMLTRQVKSDMSDTSSSAAAKKLLKPTPSGNSFVNILGSTPRHTSSGGGGLNVQVNNKVDSSKPSTSTDSMETQKGNITIRIKKAVLQQHAVKPKFVAGDNKKQLSSPLVQSTSVEESPVGCVKSISFPSNLVSIGGDGSASPLVDDGAHLNVGETVVIGEMPKKKQKKVAGGKKPPAAVAQPTITTSRPVAVSNSNAVPNNKTFDDLLMEEIQLQSSNDCQTIDQDAFLNRFVDESLLDDFKPQPQTVEQLKNGLIHDPLMPSVSANADLFEDSLLVPIFMKAEVIESPPVNDYSLLKWDDSNNNPPTPAAVNTYGVRRCGAALYVFGRGYDSIRNSVQMAMLDHDKIKIENSTLYDQLALAPTVQPQPSTSSCVPSDYYLNRPYEPVRIGLSRKRTEPMSVGLGLPPGVCPIVVRPGDISPCSVVGSNCIVGQRGKKEQLKALQLGVSPTTPQQQRLGDGFTAPMPTLQPRLGHFPPVFQRKTIQSARNSPTHPTGSMAFAVQMSDRCASAPVICDVDLANSNSSSPSGSDCSPFSQTAKPPLLLPTTASVISSDVPMVSRVVSVASRRSTQLASVDSTLHTMLAGALHKGKTNAVGTNLKRQRSVVVQPTNVVPTNITYGSSSQSSQVANGIYYASADLKRQKLVEGLQHYVVEANSSATELYGGSNHSRRF